MTLDKYIHLLCPALAYIRDIKLKATGAWRRNVRVIVLICTYMDIFVSVTYNKPILINLQCLVI